MNPSSKTIRKTTQTLIPLTHEPPDGVYDIFPAHPVAPGSVQAGYESLAQRLRGERTIIIDGFEGIDWEEFRAGLDVALRAGGTEATWHCIDDALRPEEEIERMVSPFLGGDDPLFGRRFSGSLADFFDRNALARLRPTPSRTNIVYGCGAALAGWDGVLVYVDLPKNELQFRSRAGWVRCIGRRQPDAPKPQYKRFYFVDWPALNAHKAELLERIDLAVDGQRPGAPVHVDGRTMRAALGEMARGCFRVRPWFEPGPWGGQWIREKIPGLSPDVPNYAWSFELIVPENGILLESDGILLELSFDCLMFQEHRRVLGDFADLFRYEFPIRFDFLDTFDGGNLSLQCHPRLAYIRRHFGETFTQDETYYILDAGPGAEVYLGFREDVNPAEFERELRRSFNDATEFDVRRFVNVEPAAKHDLFLIPNGTIHCSGRDNLVLEISATPYIFTFKMYDWLRLDLEGRPRPLNIDRAMENLYFDRRGEAVKRELVSKPTVIESGDGWQLLHLPTHAQHFYDIHRFEFTGTVSAQTNGTPHVLSLVEGSNVLIETANGTRRRFQYAETFVVPAAAGSYRLVSEDGAPLKVVKAFLKSNAAELLAP